MSQVDLQKLQRFREKLYEAVLYGFGKILSKYNEFAYDTIVRDVGYEILLYLEEEGFSFNRSNDITDIEGVIQLFVENGFVDKLEIEPAEKGDNFIWHNLFGLKAYEKLQSITANPFLSCPLNAALVYVANQNGKTLRLHKKKFRTKEKIAESQEEIIDKRNPRGQGFDPIVIENARLYELAEEKNQQLVESSAKLRQTNQLLKVEIAEKKKLEAELRELNRNLGKRVEEEVEKRQESDQIATQQSKMAAIGEMISLIAHQWRQPLTTISALNINLEFGFRENENENKEEMDLVRGINEQVQYLSSTIDDFRNFLRPTRSSETVVSDQVVQKAVQLIAKTLELEQIELLEDYHFHKEIETYPNELIQVILNIIRNAIEEFEVKKIENPKIMIKGEELEDCIKIEVEDNAGGILEEHIPKVFEQHFTTKKDSIGTGLGLYMSKIIIEKHCGGRLSVRNGKEGACFTICLPFHFSQKESSC